METDWIILSEWYFAVNDPKLPKIAKMNKLISWLHVTYNETMNKYDEMVVTITIFCREPLNFGLFSISFGY